MPKVRAVVLNYNGGDTVLRCVEHVLATDWATGDLEVVVVDNASSDGSDDAIERTFPSVRLLRSGANLGFPANNLAMGDLDDVDYVALVNNDAFVPPDWLTPLVETLEDDSKIGAACPKILFEPTFVEMVIESPTFSLSGTDQRRLAVRVSGVEVDGEDCWRTSQFAEGFWGPEHGEDDESLFQWTNGQGHLRVPVAVNGPDGSDGTMARIRLAAPMTTDVVVRSGESKVRLHVFEWPKWFDVPLSGRPFDVVNNAGGVVLDDGSGADRGFLQPDDGTYDEGVDVFSWCGAGVLLRRAYLRDVGLFDERFFMYYEDTDLSWRAQARAWRHRYVPESVIRHVHAATSVEGSAMFAHYVERNRLLVLLKNAPARLAIRAPLRFILSTASYLRRDVVFPLLISRPPRMTVVRRRVKSFLDYLRLVPAMSIARLRLRRRQLMADSAVMDTMVSTR